MKRENYGKVAEELEIDSGQVQAVQALLEDGATVPFIARYRKERTGSLDDVSIRKVKERLEELEKLEKRRESILDSLTERDMLDEELERELRGASTEAELEDIYLPYRRKRKTRADRAREKGLGRLAEMIFRQEKGVEGKAEELARSAQEVESPLQALSGARDIVAEWINEDRKARRKLRRLFREEGKVKVEGKACPEEEKFRDYFDYEERISDIPSHRALAIFRGEKKNCLQVSVRPPEGIAYALLRREFVEKGEGGESYRQLLEALEDSYDRLLGPSLENEARGEIKERADEEAIRVFATNLRQLLMAPPLGEKVVLAVDPGFKNGCKMACLDRDGEPLAYGTVYPHQPRGEKERAREEILALIENHGVEAVAIGDGTASRETERLFRGWELPDSLPIARVSEKGASIYSVSEVAQKEFPELDPTLRGAVSIGRRLMDPLAELVKLDPKTIGVGQYQHDVDQVRLKKKLEEVVESCVNRVGVELNTASKELLTFVSGLGPTLAERIVAYREERGLFRSLEGLKDVSGIGPKTFQQAAGFLRLRSSDCPLDSTGVHPENYDLVAEMAADLDLSLAELVGRKRLKEELSLERYVSEDVGIPTLSDIVEELRQPGRDPRQEFEPFRFARGIESIEDLEEGMTLPGLVTNVTNFGAFVDVGLHRDGLIHISELAERFVEDPGEIVTLGQRVFPVVLQVDEERERISLSLRKSQGKN